MPVTSYGAPASPPVSPGGMPVSPPGSTATKERVKNGPQCERGTEYVERILKKPAFEHSMGVVIMMNMVLIMIETDHAAESDEPLTWVEIVGWLILITFMIELTLRMLVARSQFWKDGWNTFDFAIVATDALFSLGGLILGSVFPVSTLRVFRLCKLARISKVFRVFPELRIMMAGLMGSFRAIFWGTVLLGFVLLVWAIVAVQFIHPLNKDLADRGVLENCDRCPRAFSSVLNATLTFWQQIVCGDSWGQATIPIIEDQPLTAFYFMAVFLTVGVAVMNLILGVVVNVAQSEHDRLKGELADEAELSRMMASGNLLNICHDMDADGSGELSQEELLFGYDEREDFREAITELSLCRQDLTIAFAGMDADKSGAVSYMEFVNKIYKLKDTDTQFLCERINYNLSLVKDLVFSQQKEIRALESQELVELDALTSLAAEQQNGSAPSEIKEELDANTAASVNVEIEALTSLGAEQQLNRADVAPVAVAEQRNGTAPSEIKDKLDASTGETPATTGEDGEQQKLPQKEEGQPLADGSRQSPMLAEATGLTLDCMSPGENGISVPGNSARTGSPRWMNTAADDKICREILDSLNIVSQHLQGEFRETLKRMEASLSRHEEGLEKVANRKAKPTTPRGQQLPQAPGIEIESNNRASGFVSLPMCCRV
jgi:voltage-gated sodium channel